MEVCLLRSSLLSVWRGPSEWVRAGLASSLLAVACATSYAATFSIHPPRDGAPLVTDADIARAESVVTEVAAEFDMERTKDDSPEVQEHLLRGEYGFHLVAEYEKIPGNSASAVLIFVKASQGTRSGSVQTHGDRHAGSSSRTSKRPA